jgi:hypothetical protein
MDTNVSTVLVGWVAVLGYLTLCGILMGLQ